MDDDEIENGEIQYRSESRVINIGNYEVEFSLFDDKFDEIECISSSQNLINNDLYIKVDDKFIKIENYIAEKIQEIYG